jgi:putative ABC transport system permease protein
MELLSTYANYFMVGLLVAVGLILLYLTALAARNPVLVKIGLRNIPRRPAQSILIVIGLTLSTIIIVSALATGDTLAYSVRTHAIQAYGRIDQIVAPPLLSLFISLGDNSTLDQAAAENEQVAELSRLFEGGFTSLLAVLEGGLPGISQNRVELLKRAAADEPLIDAVAGSIIFPTIIRNTTTGQGEPFGFIFAVDNDYDELFGLTDIDGNPVRMEALNTGVGNVFGQAANLFGLVEQAAAGLGLENVRISDVALATAAVGAALTAATSGEGVDLAQITISLDTLRSLGIDTAFLEELGLESISLADLGLTPETLSALGVTTTTVSLDSIGIDTSGVQTITNQLLAAVNLNSLGGELDRALAQVGLQLRQGDVYLSRMGAQQLDARPGDILEVYIGPLPLPFRVKAIVDQAGPMGAIAPVVLLRLDETQQLLFMRGRVNNILISNLGDEVEGIRHTPQVTARLRVLALEPSAVEQVAAILRRPSVREIAAREVNAMAAEFEEEFEGPAFLRDIIAGFAGFDASRAQLETLLAEAQQPTVSAEFSRILSDQDVRSWLSNLSLQGQDRADLRSALAALNQFDVLEPLNKATLVSVAEVGGTVFSTAFSIFGILSIVAGVLLIFLIFVMLAAERRSEMGMARAVGMQRIDLVQMFVTEGVIYDLLAAALGVLLGLGISYALVGFMGNLFQTATAQLAGQAGMFQVRFNATTMTIVIGYCLGVLFTFVVVTAASWRVSRLNIVSAIRDLEEPPGRTRTTRWGRAVRFLFGPLLIVLGALIANNGLSNGFGLVLTGASLLLTGVAFLLGGLLEWRNLPTAWVGRIVYTLIGAGLLVVWALPWDSWTAELIPQRVPDASLILRFIFGAPLLILGAILIIMFNADLPAALFSRLFSRVNALAPVIKTAIAYPLSARFRTGMAMLLFAMVISTVTLMSVVIQATQTLVAPDSERNAGFDISVSGTLFSFFDPLEDLEAELPTKPDFPVADVARVGSVAARTALAQAPGVGGIPVDRRVNLVGVNSGYIEQAATVYPMRWRAAGFADDAAVWDALRTRDDVAVVTPHMVLTGDVDPFADFEAQESEMEMDGGPDRSRWIPPLRFSGLTEGEPLPDLRYAVRSENGGPRDVQIIGVLDARTTLAGNGVWVRQSLFNEVMGEFVTPETFYIKATPGADVRALAQAVERAFLNNAVNASIMAESFAQAQALTRGILQLLQGFLALGLLVGIAALGVITTRTVVERRQQVGMLRAIGFQPGMVGLAFLLESSFIALSGIVVGVGVGVLLGQTLVAGSFDVLADGRTFTVPWLQIAGIVIGAYGFSLLTTILPAWQASRIYPAEALRYE